MRFFIAGIMQGSHTEPVLHGQSYREDLGELLESHFPEAQVYDPRAEHAGSLYYDEQEGRRVFFHHNRMCRDVDVLLAFLPEASMGTAIEMWEAYQNGAAVFAISPMEHNWAVKFLSHEIYPSVEEFQEAVRSGRLARRIRQIRGDG